MGKREVHDPNRRLFLNRLSLAAPALGTFAYRAGFCICQSGCGTVRRYPSVALIVVPSIG